MLGRSPIAAPAGSAPPGVRPDAVRPQPVATSRPRRPSANLCNGRVEITDRQKSRPRFGTLGPEGHAGGHLARNGPEGFGDRACTTPGGKSRASAAVDGALVAPRGGAGRESAGDPRNGRVRNESGRQPRARGWLLHGLEPEPGGRLARPRAPDATLAESVSAGVELGRRDVARLGSAAVPLPARDGWRFPGGDRGAPSGTRGSRRPMGLEGATDDPPPPLRARDAALGADRSPRARRA